MTMLRNDVEALIPEEVSKQIVQGVVAQSTVLSQFRKLPNMASNKLSMPVLDLLPLAYFVNGDTGTKKITKLQWDKKTIYAEEIAVILPIPEAVLADAEDSGYDIWGEAMPRIIEAFGKTIDEAVLFGVNKPANWRTSLVDTIKNVGNVKTATSDLYADLMGEGGVIAKVEEDGFMPNGVISGIEMRAKLRGLRDDLGNPIFKTDIQGASQYALDGMPMFFCNNGAWDKTKAELILGDMSQAVYSIRQDITYKILSEGVIQDPTTGAILYNLAQQDMVALRVVMRLGWEVPNPINAENEDETTRFPFAMLEPAVAPTRQTVNFTVTDGNEAAVTGAKVIVGGVAKLTNASGVASFTLPAGAYKYTIKKAGFATGTGNLTVATSTVSVEVTLADA